MANYLSTKDWRSVLKNFKSVKKTGVSETLDDYAAAVKKDDLGRMMSALEKIVEKATEVKTAQTAHQPLVDFLTNTIKAAKTEQEKLQPRLKLVSEKDEDEEGDGTLAKALAKVRQVGLDNAWNFVLVPGKPSSGLVITRKPTKKADIETAFDLKGKRGPFFMGKCYGEGGKFVFEMEATPPAGLAKAAKNGALLHAEMNIKVLVRGGGVELDSDTDIEPIEEGTGSATPPPTTGEGGRAFFETRIDQVQRALNTIKQSPNGKAEGALDGVIGAIKLLEKQLAENGQQGLDKNLFAAQLLSMRLEIKEFLAPTEKPRRTAYPDLAYWRKLAEGIVRLDKDKHEDAWKRYMARYDQVLKQYTDDQELVGDERSAVEKVLEEALKLADLRLTTISNLNVKLDGTSSPEGKRLLAMERNYDLILASGLKGDGVDKLLTAFRALREAHAKGDTEKVNKLIGVVEQRLSETAGLARKENMDQTRVEGQQAIDKTLKPAMELIRKAAIPPRIIKDPAALREAMKTDPTLRGMIEVSLQTAKTPTEEQADKLAKAARQMLADIELRRAKQKLLLQKRQQAEESGTEEEKEQWRAMEDFVLPTDDAHEQLAEQLIVQAQLVKMSRQYEALGSPPWDSAKAEMAHELQAQLFFLEGAIAQGSINYSAPILQGDGAGASGSWWIERTEANRNDGQQPKTEKRLIFKPASMEAPVITGLPPGSGAPREVMARHLSESMVGAGFSVGVTPTTLATIDSGQLGKSRLRGAKQIKDGPALGSMQQLARNDGALGDRIKKDGIGSIAPMIDKKNFDDIAVFDMIFANLDRHPNNLLLEDDPETGRKRLVPIDHGSALPDPKSLQLNRRALTDSNVMGNGTLPQSKEPLGDQTLEALNRLDPDQMILDMKRSRDQMKLRHPETEGMISDAAIEAAAARVRFIKAVGKSVPVEMLFAMLGEGALRIATCDPDDLPDLIETLKAEIAEQRKDNAEVNAILSDIEAPGRFGMAQVASQLHGLGWTWHLGPNDVGPWVRANPKLVARILKTQMPNPMIEKEIQKHLPAAKLVNPQIETKLAKLSPTYQLGEVIEQANDVLKNGPNLKNATLSDLEQQFGVLGGTAKLREAYAAFPKHQDAEPSLPDDPEDDDLISVRKHQIGVLTTWKAFDEAGGMDAYLGLGAEFQRDMDIYSAYIWLKNVEMSKEGTESLLALDEEELDEKVASNYLAFSGDVTEKLRAMRSPKERDDLFAKRLEAARKLWTEGKSAAAIAALSSLLIAVNSQMTTEAEFLKDTESQWARFEDTLRNETEEVRKALAPHLGRLKAQMDTADLTIDRGIRDRTIAEGKALIETQKLGDEAPLFKVSQRVDQIVAVVQRQRAMPWYSALDERLEKLKASVEDFDVGTAEMRLRQLDESLRAAETLQDALGDIAPDDLPLEAKTLLEPWSANISNYSGLNRAGAVAEEIRKLLEPVAN